MTTQNDYSKRPVWLLCEGNDCYFFFMRVLEKLEMLNVYCLDVKGINDRDLFRGVIKKTNYNNTKVIVYVRDAEYESVDGAVNYESVIKSIKSRFASIDLSVGDKPIELTYTGRKQAGYIILTNNDGNVGTLEDLCLSIAVDNDAVDDAVSTVDYVNDKRNGKVLKHAHKRKLHIAFALNGKEKMVGAKTGEAVTNGGLNLDHDRFKSIRKFLTLINECP
ncbi:MAG: hypothetical protein LBT84_00350 [Spirochaetia bacterium]|jgi:hypothetical protein|nr:hypothetical protein [Spirochaetia bacterium]